MLNSDSHLRRSLGFNGIVVAQGKLKGATVPVVKHYINRIFRKLARQQTPLCKRGEAVGARDIRELLILLCVMLVVVFLWQRGEPELLPNSDEVRMAFRSR